MRTVNFIIQWIIRMGIFFFHMERNENNAHLIFGRCGFTFFCKSPFYLHNGTGVIVKYKKNAISKFKIRKITFYIPKKKWFAQILLTEKNIQCLRDSISNNLRCVLGVVRLLRQQFFLIHTRLRAYTCFFHYY